MENNRKIKEVPYLSKNLSWCSAVGILILNFGTLEWLIFRFLRQHLEAETFERCKKLHFKDRLKYVAGCLDNSDQEEADRIAFDQFSKKLDSVRQLRNHVAHGHFMITLDEELEGQATLSLPRDLDQPFDGESRTLTFEELFEGLTLLDETIELFVRLSNYGEYIHLKVTSGDSKDSSLKGSSSDH